MEIGMPTLIETETLEDCARLCRELGLQFIELNMNLPQYQTDQIDPEVFAAAAERYGLYYTIHLEENLNVGDFNPRVAEAYRQTVWDTITLAKVLGCPTLNMHLSPGIHFTLPDRKVFLFDVYREQYLESLRLFRDQCEALIGGGGLQICVENSGGYTGVQPEALDLLLDSPIFGLTYDIGHDHVIGSADGPIIHARADRLRHMHMHDSAGPRDHLALGTGELDLPAYLDLARRHHCRVVLETKTVAGLRQSVTWLRTRI